MWVIELNTDTDNDRQWSLCSLCYVGDIMKGGSTIITTYLILMVTGWENLYIPYCCLSILLVTGWENLYITYCCLSILMVTSWKNLYITYCCLSILVVTGWENLCIPYCCLSILMVTGWENLASLERIPTVKTRYICSIEIYSLMNCIISWKNFICIFFIYLKAFLRWEIYI